MKLEKIKNKFIKIGDLVCFVSDIYPYTLETKKFKITSWIFANDISSYQKIIFRNNYLLNEKNLKKYELFNFKGNIYWFGESYNCLGIDESNQYIYHCPKLTFAFSNTFCLEFDKKISEKKYISTYIEIENGILIKEEIIEILEKIENKIIDFISYKFSFNESKNIFLNSKFLNNNFDIEVEKKIKEIFKMEIFLKSSKDSSKRINDVIEIIKFNIKKSDFVSALRSSRTLRNCIMEFIYDDYFMPISLELQLLLGDLKYAKETLNGLNEKEIEEKIKKIIEKIYYPSKIYISLAKKLVNDRQNYYAIPTYFSSTKFEDLNIKIFEFKKSEIEIIDFIKNKILSNEDCKLWDLCSAITNNAIHKNNYDFENFDGWWINKNEIEIITNIIEIFLNVLIKYNKYKILDK